MKGLRNWALHGDCDSDSESQSESITSLPVARAPVTSGLDALSDGLDRDLHLELEPCQASISNTSTRPDHNRICRLGCWHHETSIIEAHCHVALAA
jgi:hypothetical protein